MNTTGQSWWDRKSRQGAVEINGSWVSVLHVEIGYDEGTCRPKIGYGVRVANDWNMSNKFYLKATTIKKLIVKIKKHEYQLVQ